MVGRRNAMGTPRKDAERHGHTTLHDGVSPTYNAWNTMKYRCSNPRGYNYKWFGARGVKVCDRWLHSFTNFLADMGEKPKDTKLCRKDKDRDYEPENCYWGVHAGGGTRKGSNKPSNPKTIARASRSVT